MEMEPRSAEAATPDAEKELKYPVREEQQPVRNFTPVQIAILFIQFCMVGVLLGAIMSNDSDKKDVAPPQKIIVVSVERDRKAGGGIKYRIVSGKNGGIEAIILEKLSSGELSATSDASEMDEQNTNAIRLMPTTDSPKKEDTQKQRVTRPLQLSIAKKASMPSPPIPPPWLTLASPGPSMYSRVTNQGMPKEKPTTRAPLGISYGRNDFFRG